MYRLTAFKVRAAEDILERYRRVLIETQQIDCVAFERDLCAGWKQTFVKIRVLIVELLRIHRFTYLAAYYMQHEHPDRPAVEFPPRLCRLYGVKDYEAPGRQQKQAEFWFKYFTCGEPPAPEQPQRAPRTRRTEAQLEPAVSDDWSNLPPVRFDY